MSDRYLRHIQYLECLDFPSRERSEYVPSNHLEELTDIRFNERYRMTKASFYKLLHLINGKLDNGRFQKEDMLLVKLRYFATGSAQNVTGHIIGVSQPSVSRIVSQVSRLLAELYDQFIKWPNGNETDLAKEFESLVTERYPNSIGMPNIIGAIDGTHIEILGCRLPNRENYRNRKTTISQNVQAVCDAKLRFTNVVAR